VSAPSAVDELISGAEVAAVTAVAVASSAGEEPLNTARLPDEEPSICSVNSESAPLGSAVPVSEYDAVGSRRNSENVSGKDSPLGALLVASS
jgi:hypothetical protein